MKLWCEPTATNVVQVPERFSGLEQYCKVMQTNILAEYWAMIEQLPRPRSHLPSQYPRLSIARTGGNEDATFLVTSTAEDPIDSLSEHLVSLECAGQRSNEYFVVVKVKKVLGMDGQALELFLTPTPPASLQPEFLVDWGYIGRMNAP
jgi:hypothetical protein